MSSSSSPPSSSPPSSPNVAPNNSSTQTAYKGYSFEVKGKVQGVFFRKCTVQRAQQLQLMGWVRNTHRGTVEWAFAADATMTTALNDMRHWLWHVGSPQSRIETTTFTPLSEEQIALIRHKYLHFTKLPTTKRSDDEKYKM